MTKDTTTLYASDRDVFLFLVDDTRPIEAGRLPNGDPDLYFRGSIAGTATSARRRWPRRRSSCAQSVRRNIWGAEGFEEISIRHIKFAANRFAHEEAQVVEFRQFAASAVHGRDQSMTRMGRHA